MCCIANDEAVEKRSRSMEQISKDAYARGYIDCDNDWIESFVEIIQSIWDNGEEMAPILSALQDQLVSRDKEVKELQSEIEELQRENTSLKLQKAMLNGRIDEYERIQMSQNKIDKEVYLKNKKRKQVMENLNFPNSLVDETLYDVYNRSLGKKK